MSGGNAFPHLMIRASAGSGKTYRLATRYIGLLAAGAAPDEILATTFTRKAAGEILERVLRQLAEAAQDRRTCEKLSRDARADELTTHDCRRLLAALTRRLDRLRIGTLDSFFAQIAMTHGFELGFPPGWRIVDAAVLQRMRAEAVRQVLRNDHVEARRLLHLLTKGTAERSVSEQIRRKIESLHATYLDSPAEAWNCIPRLEGLGAEALQIALAEFEAAPLPQNKNGAPNGNWSKARREGLANATANAWGEFIRKGLAAALIQGEFTFRDHPIEGPMRAALERLVDHARACIRAELADRTAGSRELVERFHAAYEELAVDRAALDFSDVTRLLARGVAGGNLADTSFRLDARLEHLLLDEFQDTSLAQWDIIQPIVERIVRADGTQRSFFCVGDVKQAIYGWRGGNAEIFAALREAWPQVAEEPLNVSYRSAPAVIDTVNMVFGNLLENEALAEMPAVARAWADRFSPHTTIRAGAPGYACLRYAPLAEEGESQSEATLRFAAREIARLARDIPGATLGVLCRRNKTVARMIYELHKLDVRASEEGGNPLTDSPAVMVILSALRLADHPGDDVARFHVANSLLAEALGLTPDADRAAASRAAAIIRRQLLIDGYGPTCFRWARLLAPACDRRDLNRLRQLVELAWQYAPQATSRTRDFLDLVAVERVDDPSTSRIRVMTIHQAKGLEFDIAVLPELEQGLVGQPPTLIVGREDATGPISAVLIYPNKEAQWMLPEALRQICQQQSNRVAEEALCALYVALTRSARALHMIVPPPEVKRTLRCTMAAVVRHALPLGDGAEPGAVVFETGDAHWFLGEPRFARDPDAAADRAEQPAESPSAELVLATRGRRSRGLSRQTPSALESDAAVELSDLVRLDRDASFDRGTLFHAWFQKIEWLSESAGQDADPSDATLLAAAKELGLDVDVDVLLTEFRAMLRRPDVRRWLCRETFLPPGDSSRSCAVQRERSFALRKDEAILTGAIDRLVVVTEGERPVSATVLDFKTDRIDSPDPRAVDAAVARYRPQMLAYRQAAARITGLPPREIALRLLFVDAGVCREVDPA